MNLVSNIKIFQQISQKNLNKNIEENKFRNVPKWPILIQLLSALLCLSCSTVYHLFSAYSYKVDNVLSRFDYAGISVLIAGSCFPPYYYMFYCSNRKIILKFILVFLTIYLTFISTFAIIVFFISLIDKFNKPEFRRIRGFLFLTLGVSTAIPIFHYVLLL